MAWHWIGDKSLSEPMLTRFTDAYICGTKGRWVNDLCMSITGPGLHLWHLIMLFVIHDITSNSSIQLGHLNKIILNCWRPILKCLSRDFPNITMHLLSMGLADWLNLYDTFKACDAPTRQSQLPVSPWALFLLFINIYSRCCCLYWKQTCD